MRRTEAPWARPAILLILVAGMWLATPPAGAEEARSSAASPAPASPSPQASPAAPGPQSPQGSPSPQASSVPSQPPSSSPPPAASPSPAPSPSARKVPPSQRPAGIPGNAEIILRSDATHAHVFHNEQHLHTWTSEARMYGLYHPLLPWLDIRDQPHARRTEGIVLVPLATSKKLVLRQSASEVNSTFSYASRLNYAGKGFAYTFGYEKNNIDEAMFGWVSAPIGDVKLLAGASNDRLRGGGRSGGMAIFPLPLNFLVSGGGVFHKRGNTTLLALGRYSEPGKPISGPTLLSFYISNPNVRVITVQMGFGDGVLPIVRSNLDYDTGSGAIQQIFTNELVTLRAAEGANAFEVPSLYPDAANNFRENWMVGRWALFFNNTKPARGVETTLGLMYYTFPDAWRPHLGAGWAQASLPENGRPSTAHGPVAEVGAYPFRDLLLQVQAQFLNRGGTHLLVQGRLRL